MEFTPQNVCGFLLRSRLMTPEDMRAMYQRWQAEAKHDHANLGAFTRWLVARQYVTDYQATLLAAGHADPGVYFLNQYKIMERLGRGRMAGVYKAIHALGQTVAIKVLPPSRARDPLMLARFRREARLALRLKHPNVVRSFQIGQTNGLHFLVMEHLEGETLEDVLQRRERLPPAEAVRLIHQALMGLQHIHELGMVHRDLKPANLMLVPMPGEGEPGTTARSMVKILDIGLGRELFDENEPNGVTKIELTGEGMILGTPDYLAPEQARDPRAIDIRADIYSLGCVLYHLLTGQPPFPDANLISQMVRHATETAKPLQQFDPAIPDGLQQIVNYMMAKPPGQRYPTPARAAQALQMFLMADSQAPSPQAEPPQMRKYLTWLETAPSEPETSPIGSVPSAKSSAGPDARALKDIANLPIARPVAETAPSGVMPSAGSAPRRKKHKKHRSSRRSKVPIAHPAPLADLQEFDVEMVSVAEGPQSPEGDKPFGLSGRDWALLGVGAAALTVAVVIVVFIAAMIR
jgi:serine/threonine protein kinase